jgi:hypothetical protein
MFLHSQGVLLQVHYSGFVAVIVRGCYCLGYKVAVGSIASYHRYHTWKGIYPCCADYYHGVVI